MSTRSQIGYTDATGKIRYVYCHSDGYPDYVGKVLKNFYNAEKTAALVAQGGISMLGKELGGKIDFNARMEYVDDIATQCRFYARDRGEELDIDSAGSEIEYAMDSGVDYLYLLKDGVWYFTDCYKEEKNFVQL